MTIRIACIGGGPGGLFFATLARRWLPDSEVVVYERNRADDAFGFGVVFSDATLRRIDEADPVLSDGLARYGVHWDEISVWLKGERTSFAGNGMAAIDRKVLLRLLQERARQAGADLRFGEEAPDLAQLADVDLVGAADGANSPTRTAYGAGLGHTAEVAAAKFIWLGTTHLFKGLTFVHRRGEHGTFAAHAYPINDHLSTFTVETDAATWRAAGLDEFDVGQPSGPSDEKSRRYLQELFAEDLDGAEVVGNNSRWASFTTRSTRSWHRDNLVWLGDAVHTAHFSVGSGTKMAMEDAVALARQVAAHPDDLPLAIRGYETERQPQVAMVQQLARPSLSWWENFGRYHDAFEPQQFLFHFASRSIDVEKIRQRDPSLVEGVERGWLTEHGSPPLETPFAVDGVQLGTRLLRLETGPDGSALTDPQGARAPLTADPAQASGTVGLIVEAPDLEHDLPRSYAALDTPAPVIVVRGGTGLTRVLVSEQARLVHGKPTVIAQDDADAALTLILSGRADAVAVTAPEPGARA